MHILCIQGGRIIDPANNRDEVADLWIHNGMIVTAISEKQKQEVVYVVAQGLVVCPGLIDMHVHLRQPGQGHKETIATGTKAAAAGGFTSIVCMPNTLPPVDNVGVVEWIREHIEKEALINVYPTGTLTIGSKGQQLSPMGSLKEAGVVALTDDGGCIQNNQVMCKALEYAHMFDLLVMDHCQDDSLTSGAVVNEGVMSVRLGLKGWPQAAESIIVSRNILLAEQTGARIHLQHISCAGAVQLIREAKKRGISITAEVSPHHLMLTEASLVNYETCYKMNPPLRTEGDRQALIQGLLEGVIDAIATDHAPHACHEKDVEFDYAPFGIIGLETALAVSLEALYHTGKADLPFIIKCLTHVPAQILKLPKGTLSVGAEADLTIFDPSETWTFDDQSRYSLSSNSPWLGKQLKGRVKKTFVKGRQVFDC